ncbi:MAG TPA: PatB family C-S lyase, partial [Anaerolineae bacterium]|nr:PatB family C-S lyase [Anaerolineae bacterium]
EALRCRVDHGIFGYGVEPPELRPLLQERLQRLYGWQVDAEALVFVPGVMVGFNLAAHAVTEPGDGLLVQTPIYYPILRVPGNTGCTLDAMELSPPSAGALRQGDGQYQVDLDAFEAAIGPRTRIFVLCNPHNPVGRVFTRQELADMADICLRHDVVICSDEIHCDLIFDDHRHVPIATLAPEIEARTITLMAPSKTYNIAGLHASVAIIPNAELRQRFVAAQRGIVPHLDIMGYAAMLAAYAEGEPWLEQVLRYLQANRDLVFDSIRDMPGLSITRPEGTYLAWIDCREAGLEQAPHEFFLEKARVGLNKGAQFGQGGEGFVRLNFGCPRATLATALERMRAALEAR